MRNLLWRTSLYASFLIACLFVVWPPFAREGKPGRLKLGLDLRGGTHLVLQVVPPAGKSPTVEPAVLRDVIRALERRVDQLGLADPVIAEYGRHGDQVLVQLPGVKDVEQAKRLLLSAAHLSLQVVEREGVEARALSSGGPSALPPDLEVREGRLGEGSFYLLRREPLLTGRDLKTARPGRGELGQPEVAFVVSPAAATRFEAETRRHLGRRLAIVLDDRVVSAPVIEQPVGAEGRIRGHFTPEEADELAKVLRAGALPAKLRYLHERTVGPSLGTDSIRAGLWSSGAGLVFITLFLLAYYRGSGVNAFVALAANLLVLLAAMVWTDAVLTLPGIAGVVLTLGVGVDTNVLVFERIREELGLGKTVASAVRNGFDRVWVTILDTHLTALIAAAFLFQFGSGPIKGFAVTLVIGLAANVFASYFLSRLLFEWTLGTGSPTRLSI